MKKNIYTYIGHFAFWLFIYFFVLDYYFDVYDTLEALSITAIEVVFYAILVYFNYLFLIPKFLQNNKKAYYIASLILLLLSTTFLFKIMGWNILFYGGASLRYDLSTLLNHSFFVFLSSLIWYYDQLNESKRQQITLEKEKLEHELRFLKHQISPHFLFNTLNNIYALAYSKDEKAAEMIMQLSQIMRHVLQDDFDTKVKLAKEIQFLEAYLKLQQLKTTKSQNIDFYTEGINEKHEIAPLLFINFVENAFKYGDIYKNENAFINITLSADDEQQMFFFIENSKSTNVHSSEITSSNNIGIKNVERRLELLYPKKYELEIKNESDIFSVSLQIDLRK